jgi:hypothetical protein
MEAWQLTTASAGLVARENFIHNVPANRKGGRQLVYAAVGSSADPGRLQGGYINLHKVDEPSDYVLGASGRKRQDKLWVHLLSLLLVDLAILSELTGRFGRGAFKH